MKKILHFSRFAMLVVVTAFAIAMMIYVSKRSATSANNGVERRSGDAPASLVAVAPVELENDIELLHTYAGMIRPLERFSLAFEIAGRIDKLGENEHGAPLDVGDRVKAGQMLAVLDRRALEAQRADAEARLEQAQDELNRAKELRDRNKAAISVKEFRVRETNVAVAEAALELAADAYADATLASPVDGVISNRLANAGESINPQQPVFEIVQVDNVLLVVGVPESDMPEVEARAREVARYRGLDGETPEDDDQRRFKAYVELISRDRFGQAREEMVGQVRQIGETADDKTGLFEVEVLLANPDGLLKPGMVGRAHLVTERTHGFRLPSESVLFRDNQAFFFTTKNEAKDVEAMFFKIGDQPELRARRVPLGRWVEQDQQIIVPEIPDGFDSVVVRGQHRLVDGQPVKIVPAPQQPTPEIMPAISVGAAPQ